MGYTTDFTGHFKLDKPLTAEHADYLKKFAETRRMKRNPAIAETMSDATRKAVGLPIGEDAEYFVGGRGDMGQDRDQSIIDYNKSPNSQPGLWCQWTVNPDDCEDEPINTTIGHDGGDKFYHYVDWLKYIIGHFLTPWGYILNGEVEWAGEDNDDRGKIVVKDNEVTVKKGRIVYE